MDLRKAQMAIERLQDQLDKAYGRHSRPSNVIVSARGGFAVRKPMNSNSMVSTEQPEPFGLAQSFPTDEEIEANVMSFADEEH